MRRIAREHPGHLQRPALRDGAVLERAALGRLLAQREGVEVRVFLLGDAVGCAVAGQKLPDGYYHLDRMLESAMAHEVEVGCCATCMDARGIGDQALVDGARRACLQDLTDWTLWADRTITF